MPESSKRRRYARTVRPQETLEAVAAAVADRMGELGLTRTEVAERAHVDVRRIRDLLAAVDRDYREKTLAAVSRALEWQPGHLAALLDDRVTEPAGPSANDAQTLDDLARQVDELRAILVALIERRSH